MSSVVLVSVKTNIRTHSINEKLKRPGPISPPPPPPTAAAAAIAPWRCGASFSQGTNLSLSFPFVSYSASTLVYVEKEFEHPVNIEEHKVPHTIAKKW